MNYRIVLGIVISFVMMIGAMGVVQGAAPTPWDRDISNGGFTHGTAFEVAGDTYYMLGPGSIAGEIDVPGHTWIQAGQNQIVGKHYNVGPWFLPGSAWWASGEPYGALLYSVHGIIDVPPAELSATEEDWYKSHGYVHIHEFVNSGGILEDYVVYFKHTAVTAFMFNGGPGAPATNHYVEVGIDYEFPNNW
jgi:hypothetical protein